MADPYVLPNGVLRNKKNIVTAEGLEKAEGWHVGVRIAQLEEGLTLRNTYDTTHLLMVHRHLFQDLYSWAGEPRKIETRKETFEGSKVFETFSPPDRIFLELHKAFEPFEDMNKLHGSHLAEFIDHASHLHARLDRVHAFREGNGRTLRAFFSALAADRGFDMTFDVITKERMIAARIASRKDGDMSAIQHLFEDMMITENIKRLRPFIGFLKNAIPDWNDRSVMTQPRGKDISGKLIGTTPTDFALMVDNSRFVVGDVAKLPYGVQNGDDVTVQYTIDHRPRNEFK
jgi:cell filamentation protein